jgi:VWFA-related protein
MLPAAAASQEPTFHSRSNIVLVPALVRDAAGRAVYGLQAQDFVVEDDGVRQTLHLDDAPEPEPISLIVAVETGRKARREFPRIRGLDSMLGAVLAEPETQIAIVTFDSQLTLAQDFTADPDRIRATLSSLEPGDEGGAVLDAVNYSTGLLRQVPEGRQRVLLLISETRDHGSHWAGINDVVSMIGDSNVTIYALSFSPALSNMLDTERGSNRDDMSQQPDLLAPLMLAAQAMRRNTPRTLAAATGGEYELFESRKRFENHMIDFTNHLHSRYLLSFEPKGVRPGWHQLRVELANPGKMSILARSSYRAFGPDH